MPSWLRRIAKWQRSTVRLGSAVRDGQGPFEPGSSALARRPREGLHRRCGGRLPLREAALRRTHRDTEGRERRAVSLRERAGVGAQRQGQDHALRDRRQLSAVRRPDADFSAVNKAFATAAQKGANDAVPGNDGGDRGIDQIWTYLQSFQLYRPGPNSLSVATTFYVFTGGAHGSSGVTATLVDLRTGRSVPPAGRLRCRLGLEAHDHRHRPGRSQAAIRGTARLRRIARARHVRQADERSRALSLQGRCARDHLQPVRRRRVRRWDATPSTSPTAA